MHTTGEPTRIVYNGFPKLTGTLLEQRSQATKEHDHIRRRLMWEPRGHWDMYGAVLISDTQLVVAGEADMAALFMHNEGFSTMCGHATIALGRFLIDANESLYSRRKSLKYNKESGTTELRLHVPCGVVQVTVPTLSEGRSDPSRPVSFLSVPSFVTGIAIKVPIPQSYRWPELGERSFVTADFSYGGAFYCIIDAQELGFPDGLSKVDIPKMNTATKKLKAAVNTNPELFFCTKHPDSNDLGFLYSIMIVDSNLKAANVSSDAIPANEETGLCFFANQQIDRSPTGGCVAARVALAYAKGKLAIGQKWTYHSLLSQSNAGIGAFVGSVAEVLPFAADHIANSQTWPHVKVRVEGQAYYTGAYTAMVEESDDLGGNGFALNQVDNCKG